MTALAAAPPAAAQGPLDLCELHTVTDLASLDACRRWLGERRPGPLAVDTESGGLRPVTDRLRLVQIGDTRAGWAFPVPWAGAALEMIRSYPWLVMHQTAYDNRVLRHQLGYEPRWAVTEDTLLAGRIADSSRLAGLKPRAAQEIDPRAITWQAQLDDAMRRNRWTWDTVPADFPPYARYAAMDCCLTALMFEKFRPVMQAHRNVYDLERATARICAGMMDAGMMVDVPFIEAEIAARREFLGKALPWLKEAHGITSVNSNDQVGAALSRAGVKLEYFTDGGKPAIGKDPLRVYQSACPDLWWLFESLLRARKGQDVINKFLLKFLQLRDAQDIVRYSINTAKADTHRMSVTDPPMQTFDRDEPAVRGAWIPRPGHRLITIDMDQVEARLAAIFSGDRQMIADFGRADAEGRSFFLDMASRIYGEQITKKDPRYSTTKNSCYSWFYGAGPRRMALTAGVPEQQIMPVYEGLRAMYPAVTAMSRRIIREAERMPRPSVATLMGKRLYCRKGHEYALVDYKIQGSAAEWLKLKMCELDAHGYGPLLRLPVHDELILEVPEADAGTVLRDVKAILDDRTSFPVALTWGGKVLDHRWEK